MPFYKVEKLTQQEINHLGDLCVEKVINTHSEREVRKFFQENRGVCETFLKCAWVEVRIYHEKRRLNSWMVQNMISFAVGVAVTFVILSTFLVHS